MTSKQSAYAAYRAEWRAYWIERGVIRKRKGDK